MSPKSSLHPIFQIWASWNELVLKEPLTRQFLCPDSATLWRSNGFWVLHECILKIQSHFGFRVPLTYNFDWFHTDPGTQKGKMFPGTYKTTFPSHFHPEDFTFQITRKSWGVESGETDWSDRGEAARPGQAPLWSQWQHRRVTPKLGPYPSGGTRHESVEPSSSSRRPIPPENLARRHPALKRGKNW